jgi:hypothetical protein
LWEDLANDEKCGCGERASTCPVYKNISDSLTQKSAEELSFVPDLFPNGIEFIIDSSKTTSKTYLRPTNHEKKYEVYFIYLKRKLLPVIASQLNAKNSLPFLIPITTSINRFLANLQAYYYTFHFDNSLSIQYEELVKNPEKIKSEIGEFLGLSFDHIKLPEDEIPLTHQLSGNAIRYEKPLFLKIE